MVVLDIDWRGADMGRNHNQAPFIAQVCRMAHLKDEIHKGAEFSSFIEKRDAFVDIPDMVFSDATTNSWNGTLTSLVDI